MAEIAKKVASDVPATLIPNFAPEEAEKEFEDLSSSKYLPRLMLYGSKSDAVAMGKIPGGTYGLVTGKDNITPLGNEVDCLVISWRPTALDTRSEDTVVSCHKKTDPLFMEIANRADNEADSGCMYGPEYLVYIYALKKYATFLCGSKSTRKPEVAGVIKGLMSNNLTLKVTLAANKRFKWHVPVPIKCSTPHQLPTLDEIKEKVESFKNPDAGKPQVQIEAPAGKERAR
jgi:hypothetical protein